MSKSLEIKKKYSYKYIRSKMSVAILFIFCLYALYVPYGQNSHIVYAECVEIDDGDIVALV